MSGAMGARWWQHHVAVVAAAVVSTLFRTASLTLYCIFKIPIKP